MRELTQAEIEQVSGGYATSGGAAGDLILTGSGALLGFLLTGGNPLGAGLGAHAGHAFARIIID